jgi:hypothetical protein
MNSLLRCAYIEERCNSCGGNYRVTLYDMLLEHNVGREWQSPRPCSVCSVESLQYMALIPEALLRRLDRAWTGIAQTATEAGFELKVSG